MAVPSQIAIALIVGQDEENVRLNRRSVQIAGNTEEREEKRREFQVRGGGRC